MLQNMTIKAKLIGLIITTVTSLLVLSGLDLYSSSRIENLGKMVETANHLQEQVLRLRHNEKDFFHLKDEKYCQLFDDNLQKTRDIVFELEQHAKQFRFSTEKLYTIRTAIDDYELKFNSMYSEMLIIGLNEQEGLYGSLRESVRVVEELLFKLNNHQINTDILTLRRLEKDFMLRTDLKYLDSFEEEFARIQEHLQNTENIPDNTKIHINLRLNNYRSDFRELVDGYKALGLTPDKGLSGDLAKTVRELSEQVDDLMVDINNSITKARSSLRLLSIIITAIFIVTITLLVSFVVSRITKALSELKYSIDTVLESGDYSNRINIESRDEIGEIGVSFNKLLEILTGLFDDIKQVMMAVSQGNLTQRTDESTFDTGINSSLEMLSTLIQDALNISQGLATGSEQLSSASQNLANGTAEQASSLEEISSTMQEVNNQTKANEQNSLETVNLVKQTLETVNKGNEQMSVMVQSMDKISETSAEVSKIIKVIDEIAFQTNLLALNAAVEAARAGKYGKGFSVVAEEVRNLAARSADAAKSSNELIESSVKQVQEGVTNANETSEMLKSIVRNVDGVNQFVSDIALASQEQATSISQVNDSLEQINHIVQENSSISEETAATSEELRESSRTLGTMMMRFKVNDATETPVDNLWKSPETSPLNPSEDESADSSKVRKNGSPKLLILEDQGFKN